ncbi:MAG: hypothetical protein A2939_01845 [Parcubacteria group bacterium RIFCSPLOWO2_01_FULL_48_18]|nr:MAG: hypothetical protein A2939_01845 [Parcubacteria group bacterium RIFCSPLOWO2_01_FULL_48_18]
MVIYCDGGSRGNPGPAAAGVYIPDLRKNYSKYLGERTNNEAEYEAAIFALKKLKQLLGGEKASRAKLECKLDSELVVKQLNGEFKIMEEKLKPLFIDVWNLKQDFKKVSFTNVPREENTIADELVNRELDTRQEGLFGE